MPISKRDLPLEEGDHVILDQHFLLSSPHEHSIIPRLRAGLGGMVKEVFKTGQAVIEFHGMEFCFEHPYRDVTLYRRFQNSKRRAEHDARRLQ